MTLSDDKKTEPTENPKKNLHRKFQREQFLKENKRKLKRLQYENSPDFMEKCPNESSDYDD